MWMQRAYLVQYTALMMIVLLMTLASYSRQTAKKSHLIVSRVPVVNEKLDLVPRLEQSSIRWAGLFVHKQPALIAERAKALAQLLQQHDIRGRLEVSASRKEGPIMALLRARNLIKFLQREKIPLHEVRVLARARASHSGAQAELFIDKESP